MASFPKGATVKSTVTFRNKDTQALVDPTTVEIRVEKPNGAVVVKTLADEVVQNSPGVYSYTYTVDEAGWWERRWWGESVSFEAESYGKFYVRIPQT